MNSFFFSSLDTDSSLTDPLAQTSVASASPMSIAQPVSNGVTASQSERHDSTTSSGSGLDTPDQQVK